MAEGGSGHADTINSYPTRSASLHQPDGMVTQVREASTAERAQLIKEKLQTVGELASRAEQGPQRSCAPFFFRWFRWQTLPMSDGVCRAATSVEEGYD
jgi:hypothetical protein